MTKDFGFCAIEKPRMSKPASPYKSAFNFLGAAIQALINLEANRLKMQQNSVESAVRAIYGTGASLCLRFR